MKLVEYGLTPERVQALFDEATEARLFTGEDYSLDAFAESLRPSAWESGDFSSPPTPYRPDRVALTYEVGTYRAGDDEVPRAWPLPATEPVQPRCVVLTGPAAERAQELGETVPRTTLWQHGETEFRAWVRPLLPDEADCRATQRRYRD
jgi:hypothetical protein